MSSKMLLKAADSLNDVHLELEDDDHDVLHVVIPLSGCVSFKIAMKKLRMTKLKVLSWRKMTV